MYDREHDVVNAINDTCVWLPQDPVYLQWFHQQHGLLWIKGHPGVGKSTLMKHVTHDARKDKTAIFASFFFHGRGSPIQHNPAGLFRSLLHQIMMRIPHLCDQITSTFIRKRQTQGEYETHWKWNQNELQHLFVTLAEKVAKQYQIRMYVDALDECGEDAAVSLVNTFQGLADSFSICFSCRYYPLLALEDGLEILVEKNNARDIETYLRHQPIKFQLREEIVKRALGNFQWVTLVTQKVFQLLRKGKSSPAIQVMISRLPAELSILYEGFLANIEESDRPQSLKLLQWICFAMRPLSLSELRFAMAMDEDTTYHSILECQESELFVDTDEAMERRVCDLSQGLAESTKVDGKQFVQLIHQSVDDFLHDKGFQILHQSQGKIFHGTLLGSSHFRLSRSCIRYLSMNEIKRFDWFFMDWESRNNLIDKFSHLFPFLDYAHRFWISHAEIVEEQNILQPDLISLFYLNPQSPSDLFVRWAQINYIFDANSTWNGSLTFLHIACRSGLLSVLKEALVQGTDLNSLDGKHRTPLHRAAKFGHEAVVKLLLGQDSVWADCADYRGRTPLHVAAGKGHETMVKLLLEQDVAADSGDDLDQTPLSMAAKDGHETVVKLLLERDDVGIDNRDFSNDTPLSLAAMHGHEAVVRLLLERDDVTVNARKFNGQTPLSLAAQYGREAVMRLLLERADVMADSRDNWNETPLSLAVESGHEAVIKLLLERNDVKADTTNNWNETPLSLAAINGHETVIKLLLERDDVKADTRNYWA